MRLTISKAHPSATCSHIKVSNLATGATIFVTTIEDLKVNDAERDSVNEIRLKLLWRLSKATTMAQFKTYLEATDI